MKETPSTDELKKEFKSLLDSYPFLQEDEKQTIVKHTVLAHYKKGHILLKEGQVASECYAVVRGCVREYHLKDGLEKTTAIFTEGMPVNSFSSYSNKVASKSYLICSEDCVLTLGNESLIDNMCKRIPRLSEFLATEVEKEAGELQERMAFYISSSPLERFSHLIENSPNIMHRLPQHQIASYIGVSPESFSRIKKRYYQDRK